MFSSKINVAITVDFCAVYQENDSSSLRIQRAPFWAGELNMREEMIIHRADKNLKTQGSEVENEMVGRCEQWDPKMWK